MGWPTLRSVGDGRLLTLIAGLVITVSVASPVRSEDASTDHGDNRPAKLAAVGHGRVEFNRDVRPILSNHCDKCHGPAVQEADLRLDFPQRSTQPLPSRHTAIVPGDPAKSALVERVSSSDAEKRMPPDGEANPLSPAQIDILRRWIVEGAVYQRHWAYRAPERTKLPSVKNLAWCRNEIDHFILAGLEQAGLEPAPEAPRETLIRRLSLDLIDLPPTPEEVKSFVDDDTPDAYDRAVERLLASPQYGVRQALGWLDLARYADSDGYPHAGDRVVGPFRDWVVESPACGTRGAKRWGGARFQGRYFRLTNVHGNVVHKLLA